MDANPIFGVGLHSIGALSSSSCYTPQKKTTLWSWEIYWIMTATSAWLVLPILFAFLTIPNYFEVLAQASGESMIKTFGLGVIYGVGGLTFGLGIRYIGFSLNYAIAIGISAGLGTIFPLVWNPIDGFVLLIVDKFSTGPGLIVLTGIIVSLVGIMVCGLAGALRERGNNVGGDNKFQFKIGVPLAVIAGVLSAVFNFSLLAGAPIEQTAVQLGASELLKSNAIYPFSNGGAFVTNSIWATFMIVRNKSGSQFLRLPGKEGKTLAFYYLMALLSGAFWYFQFFFYGMGHTHMGTKYGFTSWALHMAMLILFSNIYGKLFKEWEGASKRPNRILHWGMLLIVVSTLIITYGNYLGEQ
jgi:L-rhamnose-H+ transport protein